ncbi:MAG: hypothetical protein EFT35_03455 [Methanophagales archaeon ANME-1-THS]|nr:MAG: hypothetical protein EFT35_03455 [Methanophagales archaeon ANME-1-THS]
MADVKAVLRAINWPGVIAGILIIALPFLGNWWIFKLGTTALVMATSPFGIDLRIFGEQISVSPLLWWLILGLKLGVVYLGVLLLTGSLLSMSHQYASIAELLVQFSARKVLWLVVGFVVVLLLVSVLLNQLPGVLGLPFQLRVPYLSGTIEPPLSVKIAESMQLTIPIFMGFTQRFIIAVVAAALGVAAWIYQKKML